MERTSPTPTTSPAPDLAVPGVAARVLTITSLQTEADAAAFRALNEEWIGRFFTIEPADRAVLDHPHERVVGRGGDILMARLAGGAQDDEIVGCVALVPMRDGVFEFSKMAVAPAARGQGFGRQIVLAGIDRARALGATSIFLGSNSKLANAVHLYESVGFSHVPPERLADLDYERANVFMELVF